MKRRFASLALAAAMAGTLSFTAQGSAQQPVATLRATVTPMQTRPGGIVTARSVQPCPGAGSVNWNNGPGVPGGNMPTNADGSWSFSFNAPMTPGSVSFNATCSVTPGGTVTAMYAQIIFTVATPGRPTFTG